MGEPENIDGALQHLEEALDACRRRLARLRAQRRAGATTPPEGTRAVAVEEAHEDALVVALAEVRWTGRMSALTFESLPHAVRLYLMRSAPGVLNPGGGVRDAVREVRQDTAARAERAREHAAARAERAREDTAARTEQAREDAAALVERARRDAAAELERARRETAARPAERRTVSAADRRAARELARRLSARRGGPS
jgi:hypothetical protein